MNPRPEDAQWVGSFAAKPDNQSSISAFYKGKEKTDSCELSSDLHIHAVV